MTPHRVLILALALAVAGAGCSSRRGNDPKTYAAKGRVVYTDGQPFPGGLVEFRATTQGHNAFGTIAKDGSFTLHTLGERDRLPGAVEGAYQVTIMPDAGQDQTATGAPPEAIHLPQTYTIKPDGDNDFTFKVPRPKRR